MARRWGIGLSVVSALLFALPLRAQQSPAPSYTIKPSDVAVPSDVPLGQYRRSIRPYRNWTLICDENLKARKRVCNVTQSIVDRSGATAFSWSLAGTSGGAPVLILRAPATVGKDQPVTLSFEDRGPPLVAKTTDCNATICIAVLALGPRLKAHVAKGAVVQISFPVTAPGGGRALVGMFGTFDGLSEAVAGI